jgi:DNA-binding transcriptional LysR family regulator
MKVAPFSQVQAFLSVARLRSFSAAGRELAVSRSAISQSVRQLEELLGVVLLNRTTRSVSLTEAGKRLAEGAGPGYSQVVSALTEAASKPGEVIGNLRLTVPRAALPFVIDSVLPRFVEKHPRVSVEVVVEDRLVDIVAEGYDAGVRLSEAIERDMVQVRVTDPFRFVVVGAPAYLARRGTPQRPEDLLHHECLTFRATGGELYAWELERGRRTWRVPVRGSVVTNDSALITNLAVGGAGLGYVFEPRAREQLRSGKLKIVLDAYAPTVPGFFIYYPSRSQRSGPLRLFVDAAREHAVRKG